VAPYHLDTIALQESEPVGVGLVRQQDGEAHSGLVEPAVVIQLTDGHAKPPLAVRVFRFDQRVPVLYRRSQNIGRFCPALYFFR